MTEMTPIADDAAARLAFGILRDAYLDLAQTLLRIEEAPARELLQAVEQRVELKLAALEDVAQMDTLEQSALIIAAGPVRAALREAHAVERGA